MARQKPPQDPNEYRMSFGDHLEELRSRLLKSLAAVVLATIVCFIFSDNVMEFVLRPATIVLKQHGENPELLSLSPPDTFMLVVKMAVLCGLILSLPAVLWQAWQFISTGLYIHERRFLRRFGLASPILFAAGVCFMYFVVLPIVLNFLVGFNKSIQVRSTHMTRWERLLLGAGPPAEPGTPSAGNGSSSSEPGSAPSETGSLPSAPGSPPEAGGPKPGPSPLQISIYDADPAHPLPGTLWYNRPDRHLRLATDDGVLEVRLQRADRTQAVSSQYSLSYYIGFILQMSLAFGVAFQLPVVVVFLAISGVVSVADMTRARRYVILAITIIAAVLTPPDVISQILLGVPMVLLFELGLLIARASKKRTTSTEA